MNIDISSNKAYTDLMDIIPDDHSRQVTANYFIEQLFNEKNEIDYVIDLGCGAGQTYDYFKKFNPNVHWYGVDIASSPEVNAREDLSKNFITYDGERLPFKNKSIDLVISTQVFEHVCHPRKLLKEIKRVLKPNSYFIGSLSQLEPYHSYSLWNYTPYGLKVLFNEADLNIIEIRPGIDAITLIIRKGLGSPQFFNRYFIKESPLNKIINLYGFLTKQNKRKLNLIKTIFSGHLVFLSKTN